MAKRINNNPSVWVQTKDGRCVPAQPEPYYRDTRPRYVKLWHCFLALGMLFKWTPQTREAYEDWLDKLTDKWMVPVEPYTDENGNWRTW